MQKQKMRHNKYEKLTIWIKLLNNWSTDLDKFLKLSKQDVTKALSQQLFFVIGAFFMTTWKSFWETISFEAWNWNLSFESFLSFSRIFFCHA